MKTIEATVQIDLANSKQITAYYKLLMSIGGHELKPPMVFGLDIGSGTSKGVEELVPLEKPKSRSRAKKVEAPDENDKGWGTSNEYPDALKEETTAEETTAEETTAEETTAEETTAEETTAEETTAEETTAEETTGNDLPLDFFRKKVADLNAEHGTAKVQELKVWLSEKFGTFKADQLTGQQRAEAFDYMKLTYNIK